MEDPIVFSLIVLFATMWQKMVYGDISNTVGVLAVKFHMQSFHDSGGWPL